MDIKIFLDIIALGQTDTIEAVLRDSPGYDVNQTNKLGTFPAILAASKNNLRLLKLLVNYGAVLDMKDGAGRTVMGWANKHENQEMIKFIENTLASSVSFSEDMPNKKAKVSDDNSNRNSFLDSGRVPSRSSIKGH